MPNIITPNAVLGQHCLWEARLPPNARPGQGPKFFARFLFDKEAAESADFAAIRTAVVQAARNAWGTQADALLKEDSVRLPFRKDIAAKGFPSWCVVWIQSSALPNYPPGIVSRFKGADGKLAKITDRAELYQGAIVKASFAVRTYGKPGGDISPGISLDLRNVLKLGDGERLTSDPGADFGEGEDRPSNTSELDELLST